MAARLTRLTQKMAIRLHLVAKSYAILSSLSRRPVRKLLDTHSYVFVEIFILHLEMQYPGHIREATETN